ncbi:hypothetical protein CYLTODRAFT_399011 [Cylindrobasidium torrendii FP15055 ss-10]|uniref:Uncharacterized protein n=1 Tax=Cylindrobasidium torrendii FP15055 ss-10 TaxID=1314674 RepID=A0A0D7B7P9_9AGAR|nr:hypothetical protein CYLTODRAFT_399011 [Cylindrobasidium torrendii FP15055 ss-10]
MPAPKLTPKPAVEKLSLAVRKDVRDTYESRREEWESEIATLLGEPIKLNFNPNEVWAYNLDGSSSSAGYTLKSYAEGFIYALKSYVEKYGDEGKAYFLEAVTQSEVTLGVNTLGDKCPVIDSLVKDGVYHILFRHDSLGSNTSSLSDSLVTALEGAPHPGFTISTKNSIATSWDETIEELTEQFVSITGIKDLKLDPNFEANYKALSEDKKVREDWRTNFGEATLAYFQDGLKYQIEYQKFKDDEMLQEGLQEAVEKNTFVLRVVPKTKKTYNEVVIEDGVLYLQTTGEYWWCNTSNVGEGLLDIL